MVARTRVSDPALLRRNLDALSRAVADGQVQRAVELLCHIVPEYVRPQRDILAEQRNLALAAPDAFDA